jgi:iron complex transport system substrate-binding protein
MIETVGGFVDAGDAARDLTAQYRTRLAAVQDAANKLPRAPIVYFEEWGEPLISAIGWVSELITLAGGQDCFAELAQGRRAKARIIPDASEVIRRAPDIIIGSWCGRRFPIAQVKARPGWETIPAVRNNQVYEIRSAEILQPGPAALTSGLDQLCAIMEGWAASFDEIRN